MQLEQEGIAKLEDRRLGAFLEERGRLLGTFNDTARSFRDVPPIALFDEMVAHRLGLMPVPTDLKLR